jgi:two-component system CheB/CheR fusion protein
MSAKERDGDELAVVQSVENTHPRPGHLIVGIGASAGGLQAFQSFFSAMPADSGMAFVLIQHLDPDYSSALAEILAEFTSMPVCKASDGTAASPNTVAVIPPNAILKIENGVLRVAAPETPTARRSSIDIFLTSLAEDQGENAVAIILSGYGSDGTIGVAAVKERGGLTMSEAEFDHQAKVGMPKSAAAAGFVDQVLKISEMPDALLEHAKFRTKLRPSEKDDSEPAITEPLNTICAVLNSRLGRDFTEYKTNTLVRRVRRRMQVHRIDDMRQYIECLRNHPEEPELLFQEFLIGVTRFFRDPALFEKLRETIVRSIIADQASNGIPIRVWACGCATGEEAYSLAILFQEELQRAESRRGITIFATDIDERSIAYARAGLYTDAIEADISTERLARFFMREGTRYRVVKQIREMCVFSAHDLVKDPPFSRLDLVSCRNLLIYFAPRLQRRVVTTFHYSLKPHGTLWLGPSETIVNSTRLFKVIDKKGRLFRRLDVVSDLQALPNRPRPSSVSSVHQTENQALDQEIARLMTPHTPAHILVDARLDIHKFSGAVARFLEPVSGSAKLNIMRLFLGSLRAPTATLVRRAIETQRTAIDTVNVAIAGKPSAVNLIAEPISTTFVGEQCVLLVLRELESASAYLAQPHLTEDGDNQNQRELVIAREKLQTVTEELATANEELQSSNEEFQSVNEELHSTVEELETSKEELQSINEELHTVNAELSSRAESLVRTNSDLNNLFENTAVATIFLDVECRIRRFTPTVTEIFNIREDDEGRPLADFASRLVGHSIVQDAQSVLRTLVPLERELRSLDGERTFLVRTKPYRTTSNVIDGTVITLVDISERQRLERDRAQLAAIVHSSEDAIVSHDLDGNINSWNHGAQLIYGYSESEAIGKPMSLLLSEHQVDEWPKYLARLRGGESIGNLDVSRITKDKGRIHVSLKISPIRDGEGDIVGASAVARDISERKAAEERAALLMAELDHRVKNILAVVGSVVSQTLRTDAPVETLRREVEGRIAAIARAQSTLTGQGGAESSLEDLIRAELEPFRGRPNVILTSDTKGDVLLCPAASLALGMALHELATNAAKYGALSTDIGRLEVVWRVTKEDGSLQLTLLWSESGGPLVTPPQRRGFGSKLIELSLQHGLGAHVTREFRESGLRCAIQVPLKVDVGRWRPKAGNENPS